MFEINEFNEEVKSFYLNNIEEGNFPIERSTRASLRDHFLVLLAKGKLDDDIPTLNSIFNPTRRDIKIESAIKNETDKFRPLQEFIEGDTADPTDNVFKLLSILINFQPRPFNKWREQRKLNNEVKEDYQDDKTPLHKNKEIDFDHSNEIDINHEINSNHDKPIEVNLLTSDHAADQNTTKLKNKKTLLSGLKQKIAVALFGTACVIVGTQALPDKQCMYWDNDRYMVIHCDKHQGGHATIAHDEDIVAKFKKICRPDTLTTKHLNTVWYSKIGNEVEFFTSVGFGHHPEHIERSLKRLTKRILDNYAKNNTPCQNGGAK